MSGVELKGHLVRIVTLADNDVFIAPFADFDRQSQDLSSLGKRLTSGSRGSCRRTLVVLPLLFEGPRAFLAVRRLVFLRENVRVAWETHDLEELLVLFEASSLPVVEAGLTW